MLTQHDVLRVLAILRDVYTLSVDQNGAELARIWCRTLHDVTAEELERAALEYIRSDARFWPKPGQLLKYVYDERTKRGRVIAGLRGQYEQWEREEKGQGKPCPICGSILQCLACGGAATETCQCKARINVLHDHQQHYEAQVGYVGPRTGKTKGSVMVSQEAV